MQDTNRPGENSPPNTPPRTPGQTDEEYERDRNKGRPPDSDRDDTKKR